MDRIEDLCDIEVYRLTGEDIIDVLETRNILDKLTTEEIFRIIHFIRARLDFPWKEEISDCIDYYFYLKSQKLSENYF